MADQPARPAARRPAAKPVEEEKPAETKTAPAKAAPEAHDEQREERLKNVEAETPKIERRPGLTSPEPDHSDYSVEAEIRRLWPQA